MLAICCVYSLIKILSQLSIFLNKNPTTFKFIIVNFFRLFILQIKFCTTNSAPLFHIKINTLNDKIATV